MAKNIPRERVSGPLALHGGIPAVSRQPPDWPFFDDTDRQALNDVMESRIWGGYHESVAALEREFAAYHGAAHGLALTNGTVSLEIALSAAGIKPGDEVIVPPITFVASASSVLRVGAVPVFVDIDPQTINLNPERVAEHINERTRAIVAVHFAGHPVDLDLLTDLCDQHGLVLIEDCAHAHGAEWHERRVGSFGGFGSFSFQASKNMTAGEGGMLVTNDAELAERARSISNQGRRTGGEWYEHANLGTNARLTGFQATILRNQLQRLPQQVATRMERAKRLREGLLTIPGLKPTPEMIDERVTAHAFHIFSMKFDEKAFDGVPRSRVIEALQAEGVPVTAGYPQPIYRNELFRKFSHLVHDCPEAEAYCNTSIWLPHNALLADEQWIDDVLRAFRKVRENTHELVSER
ncbi:MAG TPA: DegT/DnrJ/EryC1/StrS family aminotransferase [Pyrinomonadaceae bacterium]|nr:DegT/DnrJ/EryC1/StrS family aminotransferase [Pyrinomonadaceae bacterium]